MRIVADLGTVSSGDPKILQVEKTPEIGEFNPFNGRFVLPVPDGASVDADGNSHILPQDSTSLSYLAAQALLARFPMYGHIAYNFLLDAADILDLDLSLTPAVSPIGGWTPITRAQAGRGSGLNTGTAPNSVALHAVNGSVAPARPGMLITDTIDIGPVTAGAGADEFLVWWQIYEFLTTDDVHSDFGALSGTNSPASRQIGETDQEPGYMGVHISHDDGVTWTPIGRLEPTDLVTFDTDVRLAFINGNTTGKIYLAAYAVMF